MEAIAKTKHLKGSPRKARLVIDLIRGRNVSQALNILKFTDKRAADPIAKTLRSAIANATYLAEQQNIAVDPDDLFVKTCFVDMGVHKNRRRMRPAPQGRAFREQRHYCHITILVSSDIPADTKSGKKSLQTSGEKGDGGARGKDAPKPEAIKKTKNASEAKETGNVEVEQIANVKTTKKADVEKPAVVELSEEKTQVVGTQAVVQGTPIVSDPIAEMMDTKEVPEIAKTSEGTRTETPRVEEAVEARSGTSETSETKVENDTAGTVEPPNESDILEVASPKDNKNTEAAKDDAKANAEASDAKNVQSQTSAERNETKKADNAQLDENDILEIR